MGRVTRSKSSQVESQATPSPANDDDDDSGKKSPVDTPAAPTNKPLAGTPPCSNKSLVSSWFASKEKSEEDKLAKVKADRLEKERLEG